MSSFLSTYLCFNIFNQRVITLLINIYTQFNQTVRVRSIILKSNGPNGPKNVKLFINKPSLGFEDVEDAEEPEAAQVLTFSEEDVKEGKHVNLRFVRFQYVNSIHVSLFPFDCVDLQSYLTGKTGTFVDLRCVEPR
jgi:hypothetical protein